MRAAAPPDVAVCAKVRLLDAPEHTRKLVEDLRDAGAQVVAIHGRKRATWHKKGPGARDGPADLDAIRDAKAAVGDSVVVVTNGNVRNKTDADAALVHTKAGAVMTAEGILDDPALFEDAVCSDSATEHRRKLALAFEYLDLVAAHGNPAGFRSVARRGGAGLDDGAATTRPSDDTVTAPPRRAPLTIRVVTAAPPRRAPLTMLRRRSTCLGRSTWVPRGVAATRPRTIRGGDAILNRFHCRRIAKAPLEAYDALDDLVDGPDAAAARRVLERVRRYVQGEETFSPDAARKARAEARRKQRATTREARKRFEERMIRKAKREGKPLDFYVKQGAEKPTRADLERLKAIGDEKKRLAEWNARHKQHCLKFHLGTCERGDACAFIHDAVGDVEELLSG